MKSINQQHYNKITDAWLFLLGDNFHWGYFISKKESLSQATDNLTKLMANMSGLKPGDRVLDVGCGTGNVALFLNKQYGCIVDAFSNSPKGIEIAKKQKQVKNIAQHDEVHFFVRDALNNKFSDGAYDIVWCMEMSHLLDDKEHLVKECFRCLKPGGKLILCDLMFHRALSAREIVDHSNDLRTLARSFGDARIEPYSYYKQLFNSIGLKDIHFKDISKNVNLTLKHWILNATENQDEILKHFNESEYSDFIESCEILKNFYDREIWGYGIIDGTK